MNFNIKDGTRPDKRLCDSCRYGHIMKGPKQGDEIAMCAYGADSQITPFPVVECNKYKRTGDMDEYEAAKIAWVIEVKAGKFMGFVPPKKRDDD